MNSEYIDIKWVSQDYLARCWFQTSFLISAFLMPLLYHTVFCKLSVAAYKWNHTASVFFCVAYFTSVSSVAQSCLTLCDPMDCSTPGFPVHHQLLELAQTPVHQVGDATQPSHPLLSPSPPAFSLSQHQVIFQLVSSSHQVARVLEFQLQHQSFQWIFRVDFL